MSNSVYGLVAACEENGIHAVEVGADKSKEPGLF
jgi:hypothetical protein